MDWEGQYTSNPAWNRLAECEAVLEEVREMAGADGEASRDLLRIVAVLSLVRNRMQDMDPLLSYEASMTTITGQLESVRNRLQTYVETGEIVRIQAAAEAAGPLVAHVSALPRPETRGDLKRLPDAVRSVRAESERVIEALRGQVSQQQNELERISALVANAEKRMESLDARADTAIADFQAQFSTAQEARSARFDEFTSAAQAALSDARSQFQKAHGVMDASHTKLIEEHGESIRQALEATEARLAASETEFEQRATSIVEGLEENGRTAANLVSVITNTSMAGHFKTVADSEKSAANLWRRIAVGSVAAAVAIGLFVVVLSVFVGGTGVEIAVRATVGVPLILVAGYAARESGLHRSRERHDRKLQLDLSALTPFLEQLDEESATKLRTELATKIFGHPDQYAPTDTGMLDPKELVDLLAKAISQIRR